MLSASPRVNSQMAVIDPYQILQVRRDATVHEIQQSYKRLALLHHPARTKGRKHRELQLFETLAACYETLMDKDARIRCDLLLKDNQQSMQASSHHRAEDGARHHDTSPNGHSDRNLHGSLSAASCKEKLIGRLLGLDDQRRRPYKTEDSAENLMVFMGLSSMPSLTLTSTNDSETDSCTCCTEDYDGSRETIRSSSSHATRETTGTCQTHHHQIDGQDQYEVVYPLPESNSADSDIRPSAVEYRSALPANPAPFSWTSAANHPPRICGPMDDPVSFRPLRILGCGEASSEDTSVTRKFFGNHHYHRPPLSFDSEDPVVMQSHSSMDTSLPEMHYTKNETNKLFGGPLEILYRARRWKPFTDPLKVFANVFGTPLVGENGAGEPLTSSLSNNAMIMTSPKHESLHAPRQANNVGMVEKLPSEQINRGVVVHRTRRRLGDGKQLVRTSVVRQDPCTGEKHVTVTVTTEYEPEDDAQNVDDTDPNMFVDLFCSLCYGLSAVPTTGDSKPWRCHDATACHFGSDGG